MKKIAATALLLSANALAQENSAHDVYLACQQKFQMGPEENRNFLVYLDLRQMTAMIEKGVSYFVCGVIKGPNYYALDCPSGLIERPFKIYRDTLEATGRFLTGKRGGTAMTYDCEKLSISTDLKI